MWNTVVTELSGEHVLSSITVRDTKTGEERIVNADEKDGILGVFMFVGLNPNNELFKDKVATENGYILTDDVMRTNLSGVYAAGDIRKNLSAKWSRPVPMEQSPQCRLNATSPPD